MATVQKPQQANKFQETEKGKNKRKVVPPRIIFLDKDIPTALLGQNTGNEIEVVGSDGNLMPEYKCRFYKSLRSFVISKVAQ